MSFDVSFSSSTQSMQPAFSPIGTNSNPQEVSYISKTDSDIIVSKTLAKPIIEDSIENIQQNNIFSLRESEYSTEFSVRHYNTIVFSCELDHELKEGEKIEFGRIANNYYSWWIGVTSTSFEKINQNNIKYTSAHGLKIKDFIKVIITTDYGNNSTVVMYTSNGHYTTTFTSSRLSLPAIRTTNVSVSNASIKWLLDGLTNKIWIFGDSYLDFYNARWPFYLESNSFKQNILWGYGGMQAKDALKDFKWAIEKLKIRPQYVVWCVGMNDLEGKMNQVNTSWFESTLEFIEICKKYGITPILSTTPNTPTRMHTGKNMQVRDWFAQEKIRFIDFERAVGSHIYDETVIGECCGYSSNKPLYNTTGFTWYENMIQKNIEGNQPVQGDGVHPLLDGARTMYSQILIDFPEITIND